MATTALFVEILVIGSIADIWICFALLAILSPSATTISSILDSLGQAGTVLLIPILGGTYILGWSINFLADNLFR